MSYTKTNWVNGGPPALSAENLNKIEDGIYNNDAAIAAAVSAMAGWKIKKYDVANSSTVNIPIESATRGLFFITAYSTTRAAIYAVGANSSGTTRSTLIAAASGGSGFTLTNNTNEINVANGSGSQAAIFYLTV